MASGNILSTKRFDVIKVKIEEINLDTTDPRTKVYNEETNEFVQKPRPLAQGRDLQTYGLIIIDLSYSGIKPNVGEIWWCKRTAGRWVLDHIVTSNLIERGGTSEGTAVVNRPGVPSNLIFDFNVYERNSGLEYVPYVTFDKVTYDENNNAISVLYYVINYRPCTVSGNASPNGDIQEFIWAANDETIDDENDANSQYKVVLPGPITNPKTTYWQARIRAVRKTNDLSLWSDWTAPKLPVASAQTLPPAPASGNIVTDYVGIQVANDVNIKYAFRVTWSDIGFWDVLGGDFSDDVAAYQVQVMAIRTPTAVNLPDVLKFVDSSNNTWEIAPQPIERIEITDLDNAEAEEWVSYGTLSSSITSTTNVIPVLANPLYERNAPFVIRIGDEQMYVYDKDANQNLIVYRQISSVSAQAQSAGTTVQLLLNKKKYSVIVGPLDQPKTWYRVTRIRTIDRYGRIGNWSNWTDPILNVPESATLTLIQDSSVDEGPRRFDAYVDGSKDIQDSSIYNTAINPSTITSSELAQVITVGDSSLQTIQATNADYNGALSISDSGLTLTSGGATIVSLPLNGNPAYFNGQVSASALDSQDARIAGSSRIPQASILTLSGGQIKAPSTAPSTSLVFPNSLTWSMGVGSTASTGSKWNLWIDNAGGYSGNIKSVWTVLPYSGNTAREWQIGTITNGVTTLGTQAVKYRDIVVSGECHSVARINDMIFVMYYRSSSSMYINVYDRGNGSAQIYTQSITTYGYEPTLIPDPANNALIIIDSNVSSGTNSSLRFRSFSVTTSGTSKGLLTLQNTATISVSGFSNISVMSINATFSSNNTLYLGIADTIKERVLKYTVARNASGYIGTNSVTFTGSASSPANTVTFNNHGFTAGNAVSFSSISTTTGISINTRYYVVNTTTNTFQLSDTVGGTAKVLTNNGTGTINAITANTGQDDSEFSMPWGSVAPWGWAWDSTLNSGAGGFWVHDGTANNPLYSTNQYSDASTYNFSYSFGRSSSVTFTGTGSPSNYVTLSNHGLTKGNSVIFSSITTTTGIFRNKIYYATGPAVTFQTTANTVTLPGHGLTAGTTVSFSNVTTTTGIDTVSTYYVINSNPSTFQLASTIGGLALPLTNNGTGILSAVTPNVFALSDTVGGAIKTLTNSGSGTLFYTTSNSSSRSIAKKPYSNIVIASTQPLSGSSEQFAFYAKKTSGIIGTTASVTFQPSTANTVTTSTAHGLTAGTAVSFTSITTTTGITTNTIYYVINPTSTTFKLSDTIDGTEKTLTNAGSGTLNYWPADLLQVLGTSSTISLSTITNVNPASGTQITPTLSTNTFPNQTPGKLTAETSTGVNGSGWSLNGDGTTSGIIPVGLVSPYAGSTAPTGWLFCDGSSFDSTIYPNLAAVLGDTYGIHSETYYYLPNLQQRFPLGKAASGTYSTLGLSAGLMDQTHDHNLSLSTSGNIVAGGTHDHDIGLNNAKIAVDQHSHNVTGTTGNIYSAYNNTLNFANGNLTIGTGHTHNAGSLGTAGDQHSHGWDPGANRTASGTANAGGHSHGHNISSSGNAIAAAANPPYIVLNYIIKT